MNTKEQVASPFQKRQPVRLGFGIMMLLLLTVVGAGVALLMYYAVRIPAITSEFNAWLGRPDSSISAGGARAEKVIFATLIYCAPMALGILVYVLHYTVNFFAGIMATSQTDEEDERFRME